MLSVSINITGDTQTVNKLKKLGQSFYQLQTAMESIGKSLDDYYGNRAFLSQGGAFHSVWSDLAKSTIKDRDHAAGTSNAQPLITGHPDGMQHSFNYKATQTGVTIGNAKSYFKYHQSSAPRTKLPRRQMLGVNDYVRQVVRDIINAEVGNKIKRAGI